MKKPIPTLFLIVMAAVMAGCSLPDKVERTTPDTQPVERMEIKAPVERKISPEPLLPPEIHYERQSEVSPAVK